MALFNKREIDIFSHLKPRIVFKGKKGWHVQSNKQGSNRVIVRSGSLLTAMETATRIFRDRVLGRALRYEALDAQE
jgi:hypothetical protein